MFKQVTNDLVKWRPPVHLWAAISQPLLHPPCPIGQYVVTHRRQSLKMQQPRDKHPLHPLQPHLQMVLVIIYGRKNVYKAITRALDLTPDRRHMAPNWLLVFHIIWALGIYSQYIHLDLLKEEMFRPIGESVSRRRYRPFHYINSSVKVLLLSFLSSAKIRRCGLTRMAGAVTDVWGQGRGAAGYTDTGEVHAPHHTTRTTSPYNLLKCVDCKLVMTAHARPLHFTPEKTNMRIRVYEGLCCSSRAADLERKYT
ncbi:hypothetical protein J6590_032271 [Homalodisca vitripennis]|nr:hypothetical protein J6590_032271 [Homalodisca vitripennis]